MMKCDHNFHFTHVSNKHMVYKCGTCDSFFRDKDDWNTNKDPQILEPINEVAIKNEKCIIQWNKDGSMKP